MYYTEEQIKQYLGILHNYTNKTVEEENRKVKCWNCHNSECFLIHLGYSICDYCGAANGHVLGYYDVKDYDRLHFRKKSIYQRKYHYEKKVNQVSKRLMAIDNHVMELLNQKYCRKRMIIIFYLIKKLLEEMGDEKYKLVYLKISPQTLENYEKWWDSYKSLLCESTSKSFQLDSQVLHIL